MQYKILELNPKEAAALGLKEKLFVQNWSFKPAFENILKMSDVKTQTFVAFSGNEAVGLGMLDKDGHLYCDIGVYVKPEYRKMGIGWALVQTLQDANGGKVSHGSGIAGSSLFFKKSLKHSHNV